MSRSTIPSKRSADAQEAAWIADEDRFVLQQAKKKAAIRVKSGRAQPVDWLAVTLAVIDPERNPLDDEIDETHFDLVDPEGLFEGLGDAQLQELEKGIDTYVALENSKSNQDYWSMMKTICQDRRKQPSDVQSSARGVNSVASDLDKLLGPKSLEDLEKLERQIRSKLSSNEAIDTDYWEHLLKSLLSYKARAKLRKVSQSVSDARAGGARKQQVADQASAPNGNGALDRDLEAGGTESSNASRHAPTSSRARLGGSALSNAEEPATKRVRTDAAESGPINPTPFDREVSRGLGENEELFIQEEDVVTKNRAQWADQHRPRKPRHFNRVQLGYEWNKYNQTHYDHDNPPPKVVQGYKFNIFYPELVDKTKAPTYRIERENGRRRGQTFAPAGEDDTCLIRFVAGPPYEDIAFRIVDKEWDYSAKRERGFKSSFDKGILQLHFQFKKIYYRK